uniref:Uncharacterized protein n=1 Tax=Arundo donax TaxID=35708 RepID=A0A0A8ZER6_ARUDO
MHASITWCMSGIPQSVSKLQLMKSYDIIRCLGKILRQDTTHVDNK